MTTVYIIRHAEAEGNIYRRMHGHYDSLITENGFLQIKALEKRFQDIRIDDVYSSDLIRTMTTAKAIYEPKSLELKTDTMLREINTGQWEDIPFGELERNCKEELYLFNNDPEKWMVTGGEYHSDVMNRMKRMVTETAEQHEGSSIAMFSHGCAIRSLIAGIMGLASEDIQKLMHCDNTAVSKLTFDQGKLEIEYYGDNSHLDKSISTLEQQKWWRENSSASDRNVWFAPVGEESDLYLQFRKDAWRTVYGKLNGFDGPGFLSDARKTTKGRPAALVYAMLGSDIAGMIQLNFEKHSEQGAGYIPFLYLQKQYRNQGIGVQLLGHAVSEFRKARRSAIHLSVAPENQIAIKFYQKYGFIKIGEVSNLDIMEKKIVRA